MTSIVKATIHDFELLANIGKQTFIESHGISASKEDIDVYVSKKYTNEIVKKDLGDPANIYHILYYNGEPAGYSKIIFDSPYAGSGMQNITKFERLYLLKQFYELKLGASLFNFNIDLSKNHGQAGAWLFVWKENHRAVNFYFKHGFTIIGSYDFPISPRHSNPNHQLLLLY